MCRRRTAATASEGDAGRPGPCSCCWPWAAVYANTKPNARQKRLWRDREQGTPTSASSSVVSPVLFTEATRLLLTKPQKLGRPQRSESFLRGRPQSTFPGTRLASHKGGVEAMRSTCPREAPQAKEVAELKGTAPTPGQ